MCLCGSKDNKMSKINPAFYLPNEIDGSIKERWLNWMKDYLKQINSQGVLDEARKVKMNAINPKYVLRNYMAQLAIDEANTGKYEMIDEFFELLKKPYAEQPEMEKWFAKRPDWARTKVGCSMLSCSS